MGKRTRCLWRLTNAENLALQQVDNIREMKVQVLYEMLDDLPDDVDRVALIGAIASKKPVETLRHIARTRRMPNSQAKITSENAKFLKDQLDL